MLEAILISCLGVVIGSFLNVCIYRLPRKISLTSPINSYCPNCDHRLYPKDLVPLFSFLLLQRKCRYCKNKISSRYFWIELLTGVLFLLTYLRFGFTYQLTPYLFFLSLLVTATFIDLEHQIIPNKLNLFGALGGFILNLLTENLGLMGMFLGFLAGGGIMFLISVLSKGGMGGGDVKLAAVIGILLGWKMTLLSLLLAFILGGVGGLILLLLKKKGKKDMIPFGPFLALGALLAVLAGNEIVTWYWQTCN